MKRCPSFTRARWLLCTHRCTRALACRCWRPCSAARRVIASRAVAEAAGDAAVYADTPEELARAMGEVAARPEWRAELGARSLDRAREFSWERTARLTHEVYEEARRRFGN